jgi:uncharacterized DUF497 family protein
MQMWQLESRVLGVGSMRKNVPALNSARVKLSFTSARRSRMGIDYGEQRMIGVGLLDYLVVLIVHVENDETIRIISMRKADGNETDIYYQNVGYF